METVKTKWKTIIFHGASRKNSPLIRKLLRYGLEIKILDNATPKL